MFFTGGKEAELFWAPLPSRGTTTALPVGGLAVVSCASGDLLPFAPDGCSCRVFVLLGG